MKGKDSYITEQTIITLPEYGIQKIKHCADSYRNIAKIFLNFQGVPEQGKVQNRQGMIYHRQMMENQYFVAEQFLNMADKLSQVATESYQFVPEEEECHLRPRRPARVADPSAAYADLPRRGAGHGAGGV